MRNLTSKAFNDLLNEVRIKPILSKEDESRFRNAIANLDLREEQENELKSYIRKLPGRDYEKAMKEAGNLSMSVDPRVTRIRRTASSHLKKYYITYI